MKYKEGNRVRIKSIDWYNENKSKSHGTVACGGKYFNYDMREWCGKIMTILTAYQTCYIMQEDGAKDLWTDEMIEGLVEEESLTPPLKHPEDSALAMLFHKTLILPEGYQFVDENGNIINATKIILEKKKKEYPKTYEECCKVLNVAVRDLDILDNMLDTSEIIYRKNLDRLLNSFRKLLICRDAYWKMAGEEMGLGKPWEPDYDGTFEDGTPIKYVIYNNGTRIVKERKSSPNHILAFPTEEMRDAFKENFDPDIENCKEFL